ncbi:pyridoxal phosphate-dependent aminotransferase [Flavobacterium lacus]|uniref:Histidinol-phosphate aminotransferase n=1 Tax=Flavobacterium lacus TaxID=1353778 RepID=A0A328X6X2_9FLAO|nr:aminotransferase class I/II-fold pyridoxal phosphate-dependent enzyme [Flavobacterium lacus]RAR51088.1 histidinol-phosphate aminotransferase [Flavobacterium lacus]
MSNRRNWLKQTSIGIVGLGIIPFEGFAIPTKEDIIEEKNVGLIRLRSNENPYGPSVLARNAMRDSINGSNRYNWELLEELIGKIAQKHNLTDQSILLGAGSSEILNLVALYCSKKSGNLIIAETTFDYWTVTAENAGLKKIAIPLTADKKHDLTAMLKAIDADTRLIYICNPNNPTGTLCASEALLNFINEATKRTKVLVDEAYLDFTDQPSLANLVSENKNLIIAKTFSKIYGLAGARIGYAIVHPETITEMNQLHFSASGSVSIPSASGALASLKDDKFVAETILLNAEARKYTIEQLENLKIRCIPSHTNFVYFSLENYNKDFFEQLKKNAILGTKIYEEKGKWSRITIGTMKEMKQFIKALT